MNSEPTAINTKDDFVRVLLELLDQAEASEWENDKTSSYLQAMAAWFSDAEKYYENTSKTIDLEEPSWQLFADMLKAATVYE